MPPSHSDLGHDPGGTLHLRPHGATALCAVVALLGLGLTLDAVLRAGWQGVLVLPMLLLILALVWTVLWAPRVVLHEDSVEVRNVLATYLIPFAVIEEVRIGAMLRLDVTTPRGTRAITAWNAPALGRDNPLRRQAIVHEQELRGRRLTGPERMVHDQQRSRSAVIKDRWERWMDRQEQAGTPNRARRDEGAAEMVTRPNVLEIAVVVVCAVLVAARTLF